MTPPPAKLRRLVVAVVLLTGIAVAGGARPAVAQPVTFTSTVVNTGSSLCMDDPNSATTAGVQLIQFTCHTAPNQNWTFTPVSGSGAYTIASSAGLCIDISGRSTADGAQVIQYTCNGQTNQEFSLQVISGTSVNLVAVHSGKCIVPTGDTTANDAVLVQEPCTTAAARVWSVPGFTTGGSGNGGFSGLPVINTNACGNASLPRDYGTNFPVPTDPNGQGFSNDTAIGWDGNSWPVYEYLAGSFFARGVTTTFSQSGTSYCGAMYTFSAYDFGGAPGRSRSSGPRPAAISPR